MSTINLTAANAQVTLATPGTYDINIAALTISPKVTFSGPGTYTVTSVAGLITSYTIEATAGANVQVTGLASALSIANLQVDGSSRLSLSSGVNALTVVHATFTGQGAGTLVIDRALLSVLSAPPTVAGFGADDKLELGGTTTDGGTYTTSYNATNGVLTLLRNGVATGSVTLSGTYASSNFSIASDGTSVAIAYVACFLRGTRIATPAGPVPIEDLAIGDLVATADGPAQPVKWIGRRAYDPLFARRNPAELLPVRIRAGALAHGVPSRDLLVSPRHAMAFDGVLVHAIELLNGRSIVQEDCAGPIEYLHLELDRHAIVLAEDAPTESYVEHGNRAIFQNAADYHATYAAGAPAGGFCRPLVNETPQADALRARLAARAGLPAAQAEAAGPLLGHVDHMAGGVVAGWAMDATERDRPVTLDILVGSTVAATVVADRYRPDMVANGTNGRQGFLVRLDPPPPADQPLTVRRRQDGAPLQGCHERRAA